jgi:hypothetical protein
MIYHIKPDIALPLTDIWANPKGAQASGEKAGFQHEARPSVRKLLVISLDYTENRGLSSKITRYNTVSDYRKNMPKKHINRNIFLNE